MNFIYRCICYDFVHEAILAASLRSWQSGGYVDRG